MWPNGLCIDYEADRLYWVDANLDCIETSDLNGGHRAKLAAVVQHPFSLTLYGDWLYVTDWLTNGIERYNKRTGGDHSTVQGKLGVPMDVQMVAKRRQKGVSTHDWSDVYLVNSQME